MGILNSIKSFSKSCFDKFKEISGKDPLSVKKMIGDAMIEYKKEGNDLVMKSNVERAGEEFISLAGKGQTVEEREEEKNKKSKDEEFDR